MVLEVEWQDFYFINWRNTLENLVSDLCGLWKIDVVESKAFQNTDFTVVVPWYVSTHTYRLHTHTASASEQSSWTSAFPTPHSLKQITTLNLRSVTEVIRFYTPLVWTLASVSLFLVKLCLFPLLMSPSSFSPLPPPLLSSLPSLNLLQYCVFFLSVVE